MGFGTLFFGYFLLLNNVSYYMLSDIVSALLITFALYKLSYINQGFSFGFISSAVFSVFGLFELVTEALRMFMIVELSAGFISTVSMIRYLIICIVTVFMLIGMRDVAREVGLNVLSVKCHRSIILTFIVYTLNILFQTSTLFSFIPSVKALALTGYIIILATMVLVVFNLISVYGCYMHICMPNDNNVEERKSKFNFINSFRQHEEEKRKEYADYKIGKMKAKAEKKKHKDNKR